jgi:lipoprotein-anchoring transpeptidase ErfK/SrfK
VLLLIVGGGAAYAFKPARIVSQNYTKTASNSIKPIKKTTTTPTTAPAAAPVATAVVNNCAGNSLNQLVLVSISQRHLWACQGTQTVYDSPVVSGIEYLAADTTPTGTYHIYGKYTDTTLKGCDSTGCWNDFVNDWMPFLHNQYGSYGLHDATWRSASDFGNISPDSANASHGCVELPLATAQWLYNWSVVGTTVTIQS